MFAGTINGSGILTIQSIRSFDDSALSRIIRLVNESHCKRSESEKWIQKFALVYTPIVIGLALTVMSIPPLFFGDWHQWFYRSLVLLVIACPCALVISTPVCIVAAVTAAARNGILIKGGTFVEIPAKLKAIAFDKTGTLTEGHPRVVSVMPQHGFSVDEILQLTASLELPSSHPFARAVVTAAGQQNLNLFDVTDFEDIPGKGVRGTIEDVEYWVGSQRFLIEQELNQQEQEKIQLASNQSACSVVVLGTGSKVCGSVILADQLRPSAKDAIHKLKNLGIDKVVMLTGDNLATAEKMGESAGVDQVIAELLPHEKVEHIESLKARHGYVAMIGDGVNDAPALAQASLGIAIAKTASDATIEISDITLVSDDLSRLPWLVLHSRRSLTIVRQNVFIAVGIKVFFVLLTLLGYSSLSAAILGDMGTSLLVIFNALRLLR